jgi:hypothetical protein
MEEKVILRELPPGYEYRQPSYIFPDDIDIVYSDTKGLAAWVACTIHHQPLRKPMAMQKKYQTLETFFKQECETKQDALDLLVMRLRLGIVDENS